MTRPVLIIAFLGLTAAPRAAEGQEHAPAPPTATSAGDGFMAPDMTTPARFDPEVAVDRAEQVLDLEANPVGVVMHAYRAVRDGNWKALAAVLVCVLVFGVRKIVAAGRRWQWLTSDFGGTLLAFAVAFAGGLGHALVAKGPGGVDGRLFLTALMVGFLAIGGYAGLWKRILVPLWAFAKGQREAFRKRLEPIPKAKAVAVGELRVR